MFIVNSIIITFIFVYIIDFSGIIIDISKALYRLLRKGRLWKGQLINKPFSCSTCMTFWTVSIYSLFYTGFIYSIGLGCIMAILVVYIKKLLNWVIYEKGL